jgi:CheY-like chemotaxis protein
MPEVSTAPARHGDATVVVVDDDDDIRAAVREVLEQDGYRTLGAGNGEEAFELLRSSPERPQLILLDLSMPVMDGWEFLLGMDSDPELNQIPVALMSAHPSIRWVFEKDQETYGFTRLLMPKPLDVPRMLTMVRSVCSSPERD